MPFKPVPDEIWKEPLKPFQGVPKRIGGPRDVSSLIRVSRWLLLGTGIIYGFVRYRYLYKKESKAQEYKNSVFQRRLDEIKVKKAESYVRDKAELKQYGIDI